MADLREVQHEDGYRIAAYRRAAKTLLELDRPIDEIVRSASPASHTDQLFDPAPRSWWEASPGLSSLPWRAFATGIAERQRYEASTSGS
jgi:hypothetical protein